MKVPLCKPFVGIEEQKAVAEVLASGWLIQGQKVERFEKMVAEYSHSKYAVATGNGTSSLVLGLLASGLHPEETVMVPSYTFVATANAVIHAKGHVRFCDVELPNGIAKDRPLFHQIFVDPLGVRDWMGSTHHRGRIVIEDAACAIGAKDVGKDVTLATFSFHASKMITTGEGGMIITDDEHIAHKARIFRNQGCKDKARNDYLPHGRNFRMTDIQGAMGVEQMKKLPEIIRQRNLISAVYNARIKAEGLPITPPEHVEGRVYQSYTCTVEKDRDRIMADLKDRGVQTRIGTQAVHRIYGEPDENFPNAAWLEDHTLSLPLYPELTHTEQDYVIEMLKEVL